MSAIPPTPAVWVTATFPGSGPHGAVGGAS